MKNNNRQEYINLSYGIVERPTEIFGLLKEYHFPGENDDHLDWINCEQGYLHNSLPHEFSDKDKEVLRDVKNKLENDDVGFNSVMEIGIARSIEHSSTFFLLNEKKESTIYVGIDITKECISHVNNWKIPNSHAFNINSGETQLVKDSLASLGIKELDLLIIDGDHSAWQIYQDFKFAELVRKGGYVFFHDTNYHPGPSMIMECIDRKLFEVEMYYAGEQDWGVATAKKL